MNHQIEHSRNIQKKYGASYYFSTLFFPKKIREATFSLYAFVREADEIVDSHENLTSDQKYSLLENYQQSFFSTEKSDNTSIELFKLTKSKFLIPSDYISSFIDAMKQDCKKTRYTTYDELRDYMYGSATVVGYMMCHIIGYKEPALIYARKLAEAMQMTNFLRDIREDYEKRDRIYIPNEDLVMHGLTEDDIKNMRISDNFKKMMAYEISRARKLYKEAEEGIVLLNKDGRFPVRLSSRLYEAILDEIEKSNYDIFAKRQRVSKIKKIIILLRTLIWTKRK